MKEMMKGNNNAMMENDVRTCLRDMCCCMRREKYKKKRSPLYKLLCSWFVPRNEQDMMCYMRRYREWSRLPMLIVERIKREEKSV